MRNIFKRRKKNKDNTIWKGDWWEKAKKFVKEKNPKIVIDESDPEYNAQKIYEHWINSFR